MFVLQLAPDKVKPLLVAMYNFYFEAPRSVHRKHKDISNVQQVGSGEFCPPGLQSICDLPIFDVLVNLDLHDGLAWTLQFNHVSILQHLGMAHPEACLDILTITQDTSWHTISLMIDEIYHVLA